ncbi:MAG: amidohydrolase family protein [Gammaproteobacteria bacterium]
MNNNLLLRNVRPMAQAAVDVLIRAGRIAEIGPQLSAPDLESVDGQNAILLPGLIEAHTHLDKSLLGLPWYRNEVGPRLIDKIENERRVKHELGIEPQRQSERQSILSVSKGSTHIRSHVDVDTQDGLKGVEGVMATRDKLKDLIDIELVAFPQSGMLIRPGTVELMDQALQNGVDVVGGIDPAGMDRDPKGHIDTIFRLAEKHGKPVDIHLHEVGELGAFSMELIIDRTQALGMQNNVTVSHAFCLGMNDKTYVAQLIEQLAKAQVHIMTTGPAARSAPPVKALRAAGVVVCSGSDGIRDTWGPYGQADMLERAMFIGLSNNLRRDDEVEQALDICTHGGAQVMALQDYGLTVGCQADLVLVEGETLAEAVVTHAPRKLVLKRGKIVARDGICIQAMP